MEQHAQEFKIRDITVPWNNNPWNLVAKVVSKSEVKAAIKTGNLWCEFLLEDETGMIKALAYCIPISYHKKLQIGQTYRFLNATPAVWSKYGNYVHDCQLTLPPIEWITPILSNNGLENQHSTKRTSSSIGNSSHDYSSDPDSDLPVTSSPEKRSKDEGEKEMQKNSTCSAVPSTSSQSHVETPTEKKIVFVKEVNKGHWGYPVCENDDCNQKLIKTAEGLWQCNECGTGFKEFLNSNWHLVIELTVCDGSTTFSVSCASKSAEKILKMSASEIANLVKENQQEELMKVAKNAAGTLHIFELPLIKMEGKNQMKRIVQSFPPTVKDAEQFIQQLMQKMKE